MTVISQPLPRMTAVTARLRASPRASEAIALTILLVALAAVLSPLVRGELPLATDTEAFYAPLAAFLHDRLGHGDLPLWSPGAFSGQPFAADAQSGVFYPPSLIALWLLSPGTGLVVIALFHYAIAALATYALVRLLGGGRLGAVYAGLAYAASGHLLARAGMLGILSGAAWLPVCLAAAEAVHRAPPRLRPLAWSGLAAALAMSILAGSQQLSFVAGLAVVLWLLCRSGRRGALLALAAGLAALALAAVAILPRLEFLQRSATPGGVADADGIGSLVLADLRALIGPYGVSHSEVTTLYAGAATPALALIALVRRPDVRRAPLVLIVLSLVWATGLVGDLRLPLVQSLASHEPVRAIALLVLMLAVLAGLALGPLVQRVSGPGLVVLGLVLAVLVGGTSAAATSYLLPLIAVGAIAVLLRRRGWAVVGGALLVAVLAGDLAWHGAHQDVPLRWRPAAQSVPHPSASARFLLARQAAEGPFRVATAAPESVLEHQLGKAGGSVASDLLLDQEAVGVGLEDVSGYNPLHLDAYSRYLQASNGKALDRHLEYAVRPATPQLRALGVRYYVSPSDRTPAGLPVVYRAGSVAVSEDPEALPLARVERAGTAPIAAHVASRTPDRVVVTTSPSTPAGRLVLADAAYPGWSVSVDGRPATALTSDGLFRAVDVGAGAHRVVWRFRPDSLLRGLLLTTVAAACVLGLALAPLVRRRRR
jgi:hypothetical protein